jgi:hypothetical protein
VALLTLSGCGSSASETDTTIAPTGTADVATPTAAPPTEAATGEQAPEPTAIPTAASDPLAELPPGAESPFVRTTNRLAVGALPLTDDTVVHIDDVVERVSFYASTYVPDDAGFSRFSQQVGSSFSGGAFVAETLAVLIRYDGSAEDLMETITSEIGAALPTPVAPQILGRLVTDVTFGRQVSPPPLTREFLMPTSSVAFALASPSDGGDVFTLFVSVTERHPDAIHAEIVRPPVVDGAEETLVSQLTIEEPWSMKTWQYDLYEDEETGAIAQGFSFSVWFEAPPEQVFTSLLSQGPWTEFADYTSLPDDFAVYSPNAFMQAFADGEITNAQVTVTP